MWEDEADDAANQRWLPSVMAELEPLAIGHYVGRDRPARGQLPGASARSPQPNWDRLQELRRDIDPDGIFPSYLGPEQGHNAQPTG